MLRTGFRRTGCFLTGCFRSGYHRSEPYLPFRLSPRPQERNLMMLRTGFRRTGCFRTGYFLTGCFRSGYRRTGCFHSGCHQISGCHRTCCRCQRYYRRRIYRRCQTSHCLSGCCRQSGRRRMRCCRRSGLFRMHCRRSGQLLHFRFRRRYPRLLLLLFPWMCYRRSCRLRHLRQYSFRQRRFRLPSCLFRQ